MEVNNNETNEINLRKIEKEANAEQYKHKL